MKKLYLLLLVFLLLFIPATNAVTPYQLDHPIRELNGYTLREVFEENNLLGDTGQSNRSLITYQKNNLLNYASFKNNPENIGQWFRSNLNINDAYYLYFKLVQISDLGSYYFRWGAVIINNPLEYSLVTSSIDRYQVGRIVNISDFNISWNGLQINLTSLDLSSLTTEQMDMYYDYYLKAVQFEIDYYEAGQDPGEYQHIFKSILNGVKNLISEMGDVWQFLNAPIVSTNPDDFGFNIDWSWDLIGVIKQIFNNLAIIILQVSFLIPTAIFNIFNIPVQISLLSLLFTNFVFVILGWILVKSLFI